MSTAMTQSAATGSPATTLIDRELVSQHLRAVYGRARDGDGQIVIYSKCPFAVAFFAPEALDSAAAYACDRSEICDVYHLVNLISPQATSDIRRRMGRGREAELRSVVALACDMDAVTADQKQHQYPTQATAMEALAAMPLAPSIVNLSGRDDGGFHVYWLLDRPMHVADAATRQTVRAISRAWQAKLKSIIHPYRLDSTFDLVRVLRIAGCLNHKYESAVTRPILIEDRRYGLEDFAKRVDIETPNRASQGLAIDISQASRIRRCKKYLQCVPDAVSGNRGHDRTFRAACECFRFGLTMENARAVMQWFNEVKTQVEMWTTEELEHKLQDAYQTIEQEGQWGCRLRLASR